MRGTEITVSASALRHNLRRTKEIAQGSKVISVVKANGYGHGIEWVAKNLEQSDCFGVAHVEEARQLRQAGIQQPILLLEGVLDNAELKLAALLNCEMVVHHAEQIELLNSEPLTKPLTVWIKINTGMNRLGFAPETFNDAWNRLSTCTNVGQVRVMTHFACADDVHDSFTLRQLEIFHAATQGKPAELSCANSAAILQYPSSHHQWVRPGIMLYGCSPIASKTAEELDLKPVMTMKSRVIAIQALNPGDSVGYACQWQAQQTARIAIVAIGYGDGYPWQAQTGTPVAINGARATIVGRVSMDMITVDVTHLASVAVHDQVELWGDIIPVEEVAAKSGTLNYELLCKVTDRVERVAVD